MLGVGMQSIAEALGGELHWISGAGARRAWVLKSETGEVGRLRFQKLFGSLAVGETATGIWTFKREGFFQPRVTVRREGETAGQNEALFAPGWGGAGPVTFASGARFLCKPGGWWRSNWQFGLMHGTAPLLQLEGMGRGSRVTIGAEARELAELPVLLLLGCYIAVLAREDEEAASVAASIG